MSQLVKKAGKFETTYSSKMNFPPKKPALGFLFLIIYFCQNLDSIQLFIETERNVPGSNTAYVATYLAMSLDLYVLYCLIVVL